MLKPSVRRWYHRAAVMQRDLTGDGTAVPISWHLSQRGALSAVDDLYAEALLGEQFELQDWFAAVPRQIDPQLRDLGEMFEPIGLTPGRADRGRHRVPRQRFP